MLPSGTRTCGRVPPRASQRCNSRSDDPVRANHQPVGGTVLIEQIFALPGVGQFTIASSIAGDLPAVMGVVFGIPGHGRRTGGDPHRCRLREGRGDGTRPRRRGTTPSRRRPDDQRVGHARQGRGEGLAQDRRRLRIGYRGKRGVTLAQLCGSARVRACRPKALIVWPSMSSHYAQGTWRQDSTTLRWPCFQWAILMTASGSFVAVSGVLRGRRQSFGDRRVRRSGRFHCCGRICGSRRQPKELMVKDPDAVTIATGERATATDSPRARLRSARLDRAARRRPG